MTANILSDRDRCNRYCTPLGGHGYGYGYDDAGDVFRCEHGIIRRCYGNTGWGYWAQRRGYWTRLHKFWTPVAYRRAIRALEAEEPTS